MQQISTTSTQYMTWKVFNGGSVRLGGLDIPLPREHLLRQLGLILEGCSLSCNRRFTDAISGSTQIMVLPRAITHILSAEQGNNKD